MANLIINLKGGTGNQLFQLAAALSLAIIYKKKCEYSIEMFKNDKYKRKLELHSLLKSLDIKEKKVKPLNKLIYLEEYDIDHPLYFTKSSPLALLANDIILEGYFLNYRIHNQEVIKKIKASINNLNIVEKFKNMEFITIHIRESHFIGSNQISKKNDTLNIKYYTEALCRITKNSALSGIKNAIVFSDLWQNPKSSKLLPQIKELLKDLDINYFNGDKEINSPIDIVNIFSLSKSSIISNSTLSWWGAYLCNGKIFSPVMNLWEPNLKVPDHWEQIYANEIKPRTHHRKYIFDTLSRIEENSNYKTYSYRRLIIVKALRKLSLKISLIFKLILIRKFLKQIGLSYENDNKTFF